MTFSFGKAAAVVAGFLALFSCVEKELAPDVPESVAGAPVFTAYVDGADSKSVIEGKLSKWDGEEWIQVVGRNGNYWFGSNTSKSLSASFTYNGDNGAYDETDVMAVYPAGSSAYAKDFGNMSVSGVTIPSEQKAVEGSYDPNAAVAVAYTSNTSLKFKNATALLKLTMGSSDIKNVTVWGDMTEVEVETDAVQTDNIYLTVHQAWKSDNAWFAAYFWGNSGSKWEKMTLVSGNMYSCSKPSGYPNVIFCRMDKNKTTTDWNSKWNQTVDLTYGSNNHFTITNPWNGKDGNAEGSWSSYTPSSTMKVPLGISGTGTVYYNGGDPIVSGFTNGYVSLNGDFKQGRTYYIAVAPAVLKGFTVEFSNDGDYNKYVVRSTSKEVKFERNTIYDLGTLFSGKEKGFFTDPAVPDADEPCTIYYRPAEDDPMYGQTGDLYAHVWLRNQSDTHISEWGTNTEKYRLVKVQDGLWSMTMTPTVREWFNEVSPIGTTPVQRIGIVARTPDSRIQSVDNFINVYDSQYGVYMPEGLQHGINYIDNSTVTLVLYDRDNAGRSHDFCNLLWDENWWGYEGKEKKPLNYDSASGCWWITLTGLNPDRQYKFQYQLGYEGNVTVTTFDPYSEIVYDRSNDQWISSYTYPNLSAEYGDTHAGRDNGFISAFKINRDVYDWKVRDFKIEDKNDLVIYELLVRDFTDNSYGEGSIKAAIGQLDYLSALGVNAIELMPIQEFDGNDSWGYGNHAYFALDKAYGTRNDYKDFIDACHQRGIAVLVDVVYNHATGAHPYAAMYWDSNENVTASNNPWFNQYAPHQWSVYHDWNHSNPMVREHIKKSLEYLLNEYKVDGFRFDLTKGFTQRGDTDSQYDDSRVGYLKEYNYHIQCVNPNAVMICEHFVDDENYELGKDGIKVWRNMSHSYTKAQKRDMSQADFTGVTNTFDGNSGMMNDWQHFGNLVGFMESHDEQRTNYEAQWSYDGSQIPFATRMARAKANAAFFLLVPGPKMIWQFGEIGYDISIEDNGRTGKKPCKTSEYMSVPERKALYDTYSRLLAFRKKNPDFFDSDVNFRWYVDASHQCGRYIFAKDRNGRMMAVFGNFGTGTQQIGVSLPSAGPWYQYDNAGAVWNGTNHTVNMAEGDFYVLVTDKANCL